MNNITPLLPTEGNPLDCVRFTALIEAIINRANHEGTQPCSSISDIEDCISNSTAFSSLENTIATLTNSYNTLRDDIYLSTGYVQTLINNQDLLLRSLIDSLEGQISSNTGLVASLQSNVGTLGIRTTALEGRVTVLETGLENLEALLGVNFEVANIVREDTSNIYTATSLINDFRLTQSLLVPSVNKNYEDVLVADKEALSTGWLRTEARNFLTEELLTKINSWTAANTFTDGPLVIDNAGVDDLTNELVSSTWVRANIAKNFLAGSIPVIYKDPSNKARLLWTAGTLTFNGVNYNIPAGGATYTTDGSFYVIADSTGNTINITTTSLTSPGSSETNKLILGTVTVGNLGSSQYNISQVNALTLRIGDFASKTIANTFLGVNTFNNNVELKGEVKITDSLLLTSTVTAETNALISSTVNPPNTVPTGDNYLATTDWVINKASAEGLFIYDNTDNLVTFNEELISEATLVSLETTKIYVQEPEIGTDDNQIATVKYVNLKIDGEIIIPEFTPVSNKLIVSYTDGYIPLPEGVTCTGTSCIGGSICRIDGGRIDIFPNTKYVYVDYSDCRVRVSDVDIAESVGKVLSYVDIEVDDSNSSGANYIVNLTPVSTTKYAPIQSPVFSGNPQAPTPAEDSSNHTIPTTEWVQDRLYDLLHKPCDAISTTRPSVINKGGLLINITPGYLPKANNADIFVDTLDQDLAMVDNTTEYIYLRYLDEKIVASTTSPHFTEGELIARVITANGVIVAIYHAEGFDPVCTAITSTYKVGFGGNILYSPDLNTATI
jgi:hypothetical protein